MSKLKKYIDTLFSEAQEHHYARRFVEAKKIYAKARNLILSTGNLSKAKDVNKDLKAKIRKEKKLSGIKENEELIMKTALSNRAKKIEKLLEGENKPIQKELDL